MRTNQILEDKLSQLYRSSKLIEHPTNDELWVNDTTVVLMPKLPDQNQLVTVQQIPDRVKRLVIWPDYRTPDMAGITLSRLNHLLGESCSIYARDTRVDFVPKQEALSKLVDWHWLGGLKPHKAIGLWVNDALVALASFSRPCPFDRNGHKSMSVELTRLVFAHGVHVTGGLTKMLAFAERQFKVDDIMTQVDLDFGNGSGFLRNGFELADTLTGKSFWLSPKADERLYEERPTGSWTQFTTTELPSKLAQAGWRQCHSLGRLKLVRYRN